MTGKTTLKSLDRTRREAGSKDNLIKEIECTEALSELIKDTGLGPDKVKYPDIKTLSEYDKHELFALNTGGFVTGGFWRLVTGLSKTTPPTTEGPSLAERILYPDNKTQQANWWNDRVIDGKLDRNLDRWKTYFRQTKKGAEQEDLLQTIQPDSQTPFVKDSRGKKFCW